MGIKDPFVAEVVRIIMKRNPWLHGRRTVVLVSRQFYNAAYEEMLTQAEEVFGLVRYPNPVLGMWLHDRDVFVQQVLILPVPWLSSYEFEIRPPA